MAWTATKTWNTGDVLSYVDANAYLRDNMAYLQDTGVWTAITFTATGWSSFGNPIFAWTKFGDWIMIRGGGIKSGSIAVTTPTTIATLPVGARPVAGNNQCFWSENLQVSGPSIVGRIDINNTGAIVFNPESVANLIGFSVSKLRFSWVN